MYNLPFVEILQVSPYLGHSDVTLELVCSLINKKIIDLKMSECRCPLLKPEMNDTLFCCLACIRPLKCYYDQILDIHFFTFSYTIGLS